MKRARYDGPHQDGVLVFDPEAAVHAAPIDHVKPGALLSQDVPARIRDELLEREDWTEVQHATGATATGKQKDGED